MKPLALARVALALTALTALTALATGCDDGGGAGADPSPDAQIATDGGVDHDAAPDGAVEPADQGPEIDQGPPADQGPQADAQVFDGVVCDEGEDPRPSHWQIASHCKGQPPDYDRVFDDSKVHRLDLVISAEQHAAAMANLQAILGGGGGRPPGGSLDDAEEPAWFQVDELRYDGLRWTHVGMRYKGNSSLRSVYQSGGRKLAFRFNFDKFEDDWPEIDNQRFFGFKKLTFSNGFNDSSLIRDKLAADLFRANGVPAARGVFAAVYADFGEGPVYMGLYTMIEDPSDELLGVQFADDGGNLYKPEGATATWIGMNPADWEKKTNEDDADWSDAEAAVAALNADRGDAATWRANLEAVVDVDAFLRYLAINQTIVNWDSYGFMNHNYYVYGDPSDDGRLVWMPWDLNEAFLIRNRPGGGGDPSEVMLDSVGASWPLIRFLLDDPVYRERYVGFLQAFLDDGYAVDDVVARARAYHDLISPYVAGPEATETTPYSNLSRGVTSFESSLDGGSSPLLPHIVQRRAAVEAAVAAEQP